MSGFWKKIKGTNSKSDSTSSELSNIPAPALVKEKEIYLIDPSDEKPYLAATDDKTSDPLLIKSQIIKSFNILLKECSAFPCFLEFLQSFEVDNYAECWLECDKFRALALSLIKKFKDNNGDSLILSLNSPCTDLKHCRSSNAKRRNSKNSSMQAVRNEIEKSNIVNALPDLVSNIPTSVANTTPLSSPDEPYSETSNNNNKTYLEFTSNSSSLKQNCSDITVSNSNSNIEEPSELQTEITVPVDDNSSFDNLKQRLFGFASQIYDRYIDVSGSKSIELPNAIREVVLDSLITHDVDSNLFAPATNYIYNFLDKEYFNKYLESEFFLKHVVEVFTGQNVSLQDILSFDAAIPYFMEYLEQEKGQPLLEFWISAFNFKEHLKKQQLSDNYDNDEAQADAMVLYDKYFSLQATHKLGFSDEVRFLVECNICQEKGPSPHCFDVPLRITLNIIQRDFLPGYVSSVLHIKFVSELVNTIQITSRRKRRSASGSTCLSDDSTSTVKSSSIASSISRSNTLLAMDSSGTKMSSTGPGSKLLKNLDDPSLAMRIDSMQILDPDSLWRRKNFTKLSCGYVDELGRFESDLQPEPDRKMESKLSKTLKKFVKIEEQKVKEDMAYKVAEMIIKDVTNVTLGAWPRHKRHARPMSCTQQQIGAIANSSPSRLQRSSSDMLLSSSHIRSRGLLSPTSGGLLSPSSGS